MKLQDEECIVKIFHHHAFTFFLRILNVVIVSIPFFVVAAFFSGVLDQIQQIFIYLGVFMVFALFMAYDLTFFYLDRLLVTNRRIVHEDWKGAFQREEHEAEIADIQDVRTSEAGILSLLPIFDFGIFELETASTKTTITFKDAPDPEGIKHFIYHMIIKPTRIRTLEDFNITNDQARKPIDEEASITGPRASR